VAGVRGLVRLGADAPDRPALEPPTAAVRQRDRLYGVAAREGFQVDNHPTPGAMVVYGGVYGVFGHIGTVRAIQGDRYEVVEQNFLDFNPNLEPHWQTFDLRSIAWPDPAVVGFIVGPPLR
jgi:hypothetical protein